MPRRLPFTAFVAHDEGRGAITIVGLVLVTGIFLAGNSRDERRQFAAESWQRVDESITSLEVCSAAEFCQPVDVSSTGLRYRNVTAAFNVSEFDSLQIAYPEKAFPFICFKHSCGYCTF